MGTFLTFGICRGKLVLPGLAILPVISLALVADVTAAPAYPLKASANRRYLVDQSNEPFLIVGEAPHSLLVNLTISDAALYLRNRASYGINTLWVELLCTPYVNGRSDGSLLNGTVPFTNTVSEGVYDLTAPNESYFVHVDTIIRMAATNGIQLLLDSLETGDWTSIALANGPSRCRTFGQYLGQRYKDFANIIWITGNDFQTWRLPTDDAVVTAVALGIKDRDTNHLQTVQLDYPVSDSLNDSNWWPIVSLNSVYSYYPSYAQPLNAYNRTNFVPVYFLEAHYEFENVQGEMGTPNVLRRQEYWSLLSGANAGHVYGNYWTWTFSAGWQNYLNSPGVAHLQYMKSFFELHRWYDLIPDQDHKVVISGFGAFNSLGNVSESDYVTAAATSDGSLAICYLPTVRTVTVDMTRMSGTTTARWFDPTAYAYTTIGGSPFANAGTRHFTPPGNNNDGESDWVLVLETKPLVTLPPIIILMEPSYGATLSGLVPLSAIVITNAGTFGVQFRSDGGNLGSEIKSRPYTSLWNTMNVVNGPHRVQAVARDLVGNRVTHTISVTVSNALPPSLFPVAAYSFDEGGGTIAADSSGNGNTGTIGGATWTISAKYGSALSFSGSNWVTVNDSASLDLSSNGVTLEAWVYPTTAFAGWTTVVLKEAPHDLAYSLLLYGESGLLRPEMYVRTSAGTLAGVQGAYGLPLNAWSHVSGTYDGVNVQLYVNGYLNLSQVVGPSAAGSVVTSAEPLRIGGNSIWGEYFVGSIDEVRVYNRALSQTEIQRDMTTPLMHAPGSLVIFRLANRRVHLRFNGTAGPPYRIQASVDLVSWKTIGNAVASAGGNFEFDDSDDEFSQRFYRWVTP
jgi:hypothetical protein